MIDEEAMDEHLPCALTEPELHARGEELAKLVGDEEACELTKKEAADHHNAEIKALQTRRSVVARELREAREYRWVPVKRVRIENTSMIQWIRQDTLELVRERPMTEAERQLELLPGVPADDPAEPTDNVADEGGKPS